MKLYVPACGDRITLTSDWTFALILEHRNMKFADARGLITDSERGRYGVQRIPGDWSSGLKFFPHVIKAGSTLEVDRVYVRNFSKSADSTETDFDSITFKVVGEKNSRFWAKRVDCNDIEFELDSTYKQRKAAG